jgi:hypothetical protein
MLFTNRSIDFSSQIVEKYSFRNGRGRYVIWGRKCICISNKWGSVAVISQTCVLNWSACFYRCCCGRLLTSHCGGPDAHSNITVENELWMPSIHTWTLPTDAFGRIKFQGAKHTSKAQVRATQIQVWSILLPVMTCFIHHLQARTTHKNFMKHRVFHIW